MRESRGYSERMNKHKITLISTVLNRSTLKNPYFVLTCPNLAPTFMCRLGRLQDAPLQVFRCVGLTVLTFSRVHIYAMRQLLESRTFYLYKNFITRLGQKHNKPSNINDLS